MERMVTARQVAKTLGVHENWVYDRAVGGDLPSYKVGGSRRFLWSEVERWLQTVARQPVAEAGAREAS